MPDIQTALSRALTEWAKDEPDQKPKQQPQPQEKAPMHNPLFAITTNVTRATFDYVRDNPGTSYKEALKALLARGYKESSITALFSQMRRAGLLVRHADGSHTAVGKEYVPMKTNEKSNYKYPTKAKSVKHLANTPPKAEPTPEPTPAPVPPPPAPVWTTNDVDYLLNTLPIRQARELYDALHKIFGGGK